MDGVGHVSSNGGGAIKLEPKSRRSQDGVIFVGCSNRRDAIDPAVRSAEECYFVGSLCVLKAPLLRLIGSRFRHDDLLIYCFCTCI
jgi:hypothetical protein